MILTLPFLNKRTYLHGTTLLDTLLSHAKYPSQFSFKIKRIIYSNRIKITSEESEHSAALSSGKNFLFVKELPPCSPVQRETFDEDALALRIQQEEGRFLVPANVAPPARSLVAAFKHVLLTWYPTPQRLGHWAFVRLDATRFSLNISTPLSLESIFCREGKACCSVCIDDIPAATLYFVWTDFEKEIL